MTVLAGNQRTETSEEMRAHGGARHARFIDETVPLHVISRVFQGRHLLRPSEELNSMIAGVLGRAQQLFTRVELFAVAFLSNHAHFMLQGPPDQVPAFLGFVAREISRRWGKQPDVDWPGTMWHRYSATALPTADSQLTCFKYILSQGTKEGLVAKPQDWPGVHCARALLNNRPLRGKWFNATGYSRRVDSECRRQHPTPVKKSDYFVDQVVRFSPIPAWRELGDDIRRERTRELVREIEVEGALSRSGRPVLGAKQVRRISLSRRTTIPAQPWLRPRRRLICWSSLQAPETVDYLARYWAFQSAFRSATKIAKEAPRLPSPLFPVGAHVPGRINLPPPVARTAA